MYGFLKEKYSRMPTTARAVVWFTFCNILLRGISFITVPVFTRILPEEEYGILSVFLSYEQILIIVATWDVYLGGFQKGVFKYRNNLKLFTSATVALANIITVICFSFIFFFQRNIKEITGMTTGLLILLFIFMLLHPAYHCWLILKRTDYAYKPAVAVTLVYSVISIALSLTAVTVIDNSAVVKYGSNLSGICLVCIIFYIRAFHPVRLVQNIETVKEYWIFLLKFQAPLILHSLSYLVLSQADRIMIGKMAGNSEAAFYSVAYNLASVVSIIQNSVNQVFTPWRYDKLENKKYDEIRQSTNIVLTGACIAISGFILTAPEIMKILFSADYYEAVWCIPPVSAGIYFMFLYSVFVNVESYFEKTQYIAYVSVICGVVNIVLNYFFIKQFGYIAAGYTTLISYILFACLHYFFMNQMCKKYLGKIRMFSGAGIVAISLSLTVFSIIVTFFYPYPFVRYVIVVVGIIALLINKDKIIWLTAKLV